MKKFLFIITILGALTTSCKSTKNNQNSTTQTKTQANSKINKTQKGAAIGSATGAVAGAIIGNKSNNTAIGAILGAVVGGSVGAVIGNKMDKQAKKIESDLGKTATVERVGEGIKVTFDSQLLFDFGKANLYESNKDKLLKLSQSLKDNPGTDILIVGHTDNVGSETFNQNLSEERAASVASYLAANGITYSRLKTAGKGESQPVSSNDTDYGRQQNRRVEIAIYANDAMKTEVKSQTGE